MEGIETKQLAVVDYVLFSLLLVVSVGIGIYSALKGRGNNSTQEYLLGGRKMAPIPVAISLLGGVISAISILGISTEMYFFGTQLCIILVGCCIGLPIIRRIILPVMYPLQAASMTKYIELRFRSTGLRMLATVCILLVGFFNMGMFMYAPSLTLSTVTNLSTTASVAIIGIICTFYITIGGVKAVVYTDVVQTLLMFIGVLTVVIVCCNDLGGVDNVFRIANEGQRLEFFNMDTNPRVRHTFWSVIVQGIYGMIAWMGLNQPTYQRFASVATIQISKRLATFFLVGLAALWMTFYFSGIVAYATYSNCDPLTSGRIEKPDQILAYLVLDKLSHLTGMAGLFVASIYGGVLSSVSSTGNSVACLLWEDILKDFRYFKDISDQSATRLIKILSAVSGIIGICLGMLAGQLGGIFQVALSITNTFSAPCCGLFLSGICMPWVNKKGAFIGFFVSVVFNLWMFIGQMASGSANPVKLPLSVEGCPEYNMTSLSSTTVGSAGTDFDVIGPLITTSVPEISPVQEEKSSSAYDLSYCYTGMLGIIIVAVVSCIVSIFTGPMKPNEVDDKLINHLSLRLYKKFWRWFASGKSKNTLDEVLSPLEKDEAAPMNLIVPLQEKEKSLQSY